MLPGQDATIFELIVTASIFTSGAIIVTRYLQKKSRNVLFLSLFCLFAGSATLCSFIARMMVNFMGFVGSENYIVSMFVRDHFAQMFLTLATIAFHYFSKIVFGEEFRLQKSSIIDIFGVGLIAFLFWAPLDPDSPVHTFGYVFLFVYVLYVFIPAILTSRHAQEKIEDPVYRAGFRSLRYMAYFYLATLILFVFDQLAILLFAWPFNPFYYAGWICAILASLTGYIGFLLPKWFKKIISRK
jgi:NADH:ubiquinone oxidoreductase subunit 3 (subunit A)